MRHTVDRIRNKPSDYVACEECDAINWYENEECVNSDCLSDMLIQVSEERIQELVADYTDGFDNPDDPYIELNV